PSIDFCTAHPYPDESWANLSVEQTRRLVEAWIKDAHEVVGKPFVLEEWNVHSNKDQYWPAILDEIEHHDAGGSLFWNYNDYSTSNFDMLHGDAILTTYFKPHAARMAAKSGTVVSQPPTGTLIPTATVVPTISPSLSPSIAPSPSLSPSPSLNPSPTPMGGFAVSYTMNDWGSGATVTVTIKNNSTSVVDNWKLEFSFPGNQKITNLWCGKYSQSGAVVSISGEAWNSSIPAGGSVNFGFNLLYSGTNAKPTAFTLNGAACQVQ
ncbi:MAG TPA: cellulose-binding domain-containing protein, partial [Bacillota bacterium]|nr:cellulose-binding domain-containing protein [Bacillota bacterium]